MATANAQRPNESEADRWTAWEGLAIRLDSKWRRLQCLIGVINHALDTHPSPHPRPSAAAPDDSWHATAAGADSEPPPSRTLPELMSARNLAFARNGGVVYQAAERSSGLDAWFLPQALCVNDGRLPAHAAGEDQAWTLSHGGEPRLVCCCRLLLTFSYRVDALCMYDLCFVLHMRACVRACVLCMHTKHKTQCIFFVCLSVCLLVRTYVVCICTHRHVRAHTHTLTPTQARRQWWSFAAGCQRRR